MRYAYTNTEVQSWEKRVTNTACVPSLHSITASEMKLCVFVLNVFLILFRIIE